ncbi:rod shape-determining protein [Myxococcota bacterium]|nr:rod shape-determining protein [Myxococcota bacterium]MBU1381510.1 rod shape-determining protein [Myxococcota bacterium]MBU1497517.1 rod shape-determining protein [Myxococcota bacterium]
MFDWLYSLFSNDLAIDLGTATTLTFVKGKGIVSHEPSVVAVQRTPMGGRRPFRFGFEAKEMLGRTPGNIEAIKPLKDGVIADFELTEKMLVYFINKAHQRRTLVKPRIIICVPAGITEVERKAVIDSALGAGAREVYLIEEPMAAAIGAGLPITEPSGNMIVDIGGGTTEVAVISLSGIVYAKSLRIGGNKLDESIINYLKKNHNFLVGEQTAENIKIQIGDALPVGDPMEMDIRGRDLIAGIPRTMHLNSLQVNEALAEPLQSIIDTIKEVLEQTPPELSADIVERGIVLTGGGALLRNLDLYIQEGTGLPASVCDNPEYAVVLGTGKALEEIRLLKEVTLVRQG